MRRRILASLAKSGYTAKDYVQDGLIAMWDGIENAGWGVHDSNATVWKDLIGTKDADLTQHGSFSKNALLCDGVGIAAQTTPFSVGSLKTLEAVFVRKSLASYLNGTMFLSGDYQYGFFKSHIGVRRESGDLIFYRKIYACPIDSLLSISWIEDSLIMNGESKSFIGENSYDRTSERGNGCYFGGSLNSFVECELLNIRCYSRVIEQEEQSSNYAIDKARFNLP